MTKSMQRTWQNIKATFEPLKAVDRREIPGKFVSGTDIFSFSFIFFWKHPLFLVEISSLSDWPNFASGSLGDRVNMSRQHYPDYIKIK